jgi:hypothetical protein
MACGISFDIEAGKLFARRSDWVEFGSRIKTKKPNGAGVLGMVARSSGET